MTELNFEIEQLLNSMEVSKDEGKRAIEIHIRYIYKLPWSWIFPEAVEDLDTLLELAEYHRDYKTDVWYLTQAEKLEEKTFKERMEVYLIDNLGFPEDKELTPLQLSVLWEAIYTQ